MQISVRCVLPVTSMSKFRKMRSTSHGETFAGRSGQLSAALVEKLVGHAVSQFDPHHGGFGSQPKFPHPSALDLLIDHVGRTGDEAAKKTVAKKAPAKKAATAKKSSR